MNPPTESTDEILARMIYHESPWIAPDGTKHYYTPALLARDETIRESK